MVKSSFIATFNNYKGSDIIKIEAIKYSEYDIYKDYHPSTHKFIKPIKWNFEPSYIIDIHYDKLKHKISKIKCAVFAEDNKWQLATIKK